MKYSASFLPNACLHPRLKPGNRSDSTGTAAQCAAHKYVDALASTVAPNATLHAACFFDGREPLRANTLLKKAASLRCGSRRGSNCCGTGPCLA
eukprot:CAMPEP_0115209578 /NCGR_PEP_ID=MMETSP0270-20121206/21809_1 /TAXON_ID=71861 /ORGANISM="Scrippsiella trochoidea, Strain CCMP3099" /LENGTH=93 /DNA_ID=CAMNT_0002623217 /DNA_START=1086 /DNA_END=1367 /DNA_ORIENTATION=-